MKEETNNLITTEDLERPQIQKLTPEERLQLFANLIIDRILEEQINGTLSTLISPIREGAIINE